MTGNIIAGWAIVAIPLVWLLVMELRRARRLGKANAALDAVLSRLRTGPPPLVVILFLALAFAAIPDAAMAQGFGGGGAPLQAFLGWLQSSVVQTIAVIAVIGVGVLLMVSHHAITSVIWVLAGVWVIFNADTLVGYLH